MQIKVSLIKNSVYITPAISVGSDEIMERNVYWLNLSFLSFDVLILFGI